MYYLLLFTLLIPSIDSIISDFSKHHNSFLNSTIKKISCDYYLHHYDRLDNGRAILVMDNSQYKISLNNKIITSDTKMMQTYFQATNQILIENSFSELDFLILNFFNYLDTNFKNNVFIKDASNNFIEINNENYKIKIFTTFNSIDSIKINTDNVNMNLYSIQLFPLYNDSNDTLFTIDKPSAFILDLRD